jgi:predicted Fe-S protein YdhL (DUF1289 family)
MHRIVSPCVKLCVIDGPSGLCEGCGRSLDEIGRWLSYSDAERHAIIGTLAARLTMLASGGTDRSGGAS